MRNRFQDIRRVFVAAGIAVAAVTVAGCSTDDLLRAEDPDIVSPSSVDNPDGAEAVRLGAMRRWVLTTAGPNTNGQESTWLFGGLLADEWATSSTFVQNDQADERRIGSDNSTVTNAFRALNRVRTAVNQAVPLMIKWRPTESAKLAELYFARAQAEMQLASDFCNGIPLSEAATGDGSIIFGDPLTSDSVFRRAIATADSGLLIATAIVSPDTQAQNILNGLRVIKARAQLGINQYAAAAATVAAVPTAFVYNHTFSTTALDNGIWGQPMSNRRYLVGDNLEGNSRNIPVANNINFFSAGDPRVPANYTITISGTKADTAKSQDGISNSRTTPLYNRGTPVAVANGIDARLIEAEAALAADNSGSTMMPILDALRATSRTIGTVTVPAMAALTNPATLAARQDLLFREKAFWTFTRGQRLGDMRRLVRQYGRASDTVYPEGTHYRGPTYGPDVTLPVPQEEQNNPKFSGCIDRLP